MITFPAVIALSAAMTAGIPTSGVDHCQDAYFNDYVRWEGESRIVATVESHGVENIDCVDEEFCNEHDNGHVLTIESVAGRRDDRLATGSRVVVFRWIGSPVCLWGAATDSLHQGSRHHFTLELRPDSLWVSDLPTFDLRPEHALGEWPGNNLHDRMLPLPQFLSLIRTLPREEDWVADCRDGTRRIELWVRSHNRYTLPERIDETRRWCEWGMRRKVSDLERKPVANLPETVMRWSRQEGCRPREDGSIEAVRGDYGTREGAPWVALCQQDEGWRLVLLTNDGNWYRELTRAPGTNRSWRLSVTSPEYFEWQTAPELRPDRRGASAVLNPPARDVVLLRYEDGDHATEDLRFAFFRSEDGWEQVVVQCCNWHAKPRPREPELGTVSGTILDASTGEPIRGAAVVVAGTNIGNLTDETGSYQINNVRAGNRLIRVTHSKYRTARNSTRVFDDEVATVDFALASKQGAIGKNQRAWAPDGSHLVFFLPWNGDEAQRELFVVRRDGGGLVNLTCNESEDANPAWSPKGDWIAYFTRVDDWLQIMAVRPNGSKRLQLTDAQAHSHSPEWSPDGAELLFESNRDGAWDLYRTGFPVADPRRVTDTPDRDGRPAWYIGERIVYYSNQDGDDEVFLRNLETSKTAQMTDHDGADYNPSWLGPGLILFVSDRDGDDEIFLLSLLDRSVRQLTNNEAREWNPYASPDRKTISFYSDRGGEEGLYLMDADGGNQRLLVSASQARDARCVVDRERDSFLD